MRALGFGQAREENTGATPGRRWKFHCPRRLRPAPTGQELEKLVLKPGIGIGELKFGATRQRIVAVLGEPQGVMRMEPMELLEYSGKGLVLLVDSKAGLQQIMAEGPSTSSNPRMRPFAGSTDKRIRIGSTRAEIEAAYGKDCGVVPVKVVNHPEIRQIQLTYPLGLLAVINTQTNRCDELILLSPFSTGPSSRPSP